VRFKRGAYDDVILVYIAAALLATLPWVPAIDDVLVRSLTMGYDPTRLSLVDLARGSRSAALAAARPDRAWLRQPGHFEAFHGSLVASATKRVHGVAECVAVVVMSVAAVVLALLRSARHAWILAVILVAWSLWTFLRMRTDLYECVGWLPGGAEAIHFWDWILPFPWLLAGEAAITLCLASWSSRRRTGVAPTIVVAHA
jgi:hypothetical protein